MKSQIAVILAALSEARGRWVSALDLHERCGSLAIHSRISDLRKRGHTIENQTDWIDGRCCSSYRLIDPGPPPEKTRSGLGPERAKTSRRGSHDKTTARPQGDLFPMPLSTPWPDWWTHPNLFDTEHRQKARCLMSPAS